MKPLLIVDDEAAIVAMLSHYFQTHGYETHTAADGIEALAVVKNGGIDRAAIPIVLEEKEQIVRKSTALECVRWDEGFETVGGLDRLKAFLEAVASLGEGA